MGHGRFGPYEVAAELGRGATTRVDLAHDLRPEGDRPGPAWVALKRPREGLDPGQRHLRALDFANEASAGLRLDHPHLIPIYEAGDIGGVPYCSLRLVHGPTLRRVLSASRAHRSAQPGLLPTGLPADLALDWLASAADALAWAALQVPGFIHRDLKPENLLVETDGRALISDYGIARYVGQGSTVSAEVDVVRGTPCYMAPEQARGEALDARTDVYALGLMGIEMFTGWQRVPHDHRGGAEQAMILADRADPTAALARVSRRVPALGSLLSAMVRRPRDERPAMDAVRVRFATLLQRLGGAATARARYARLKESWTSGTGTADRAAPPVGGRP